VRRGNWDFGQVTSPPSGRMRARNQELYLNSTTPLHYRTTYRRIIQSTKQQEFFKMSTSVWPPLPPHELKKAEEETTVPLPLHSPHLTLKLTHRTTQAREIAWLLDSLQETLVSLKAGLEECYALLAPIEPGSTLVLSSPRSECIKGHVTRVGTRVVKGVCLLFPFFFLYSI
jgi:hypothetical protein